MQEIEIEPIKESNSDWDELERLILSFFKEEFYLPLLAQIPGLSQKMLNDNRSPLVEAILSGRIWFYRGEFKGRFSGATSGELRRLGARRDRRQGSFKVLLSALPEEVKHAISQSESRFSMTLQRIDARLRDIIPEELAEKFQASNFFDKTIYKVDKNIRHSVEYKSKKIAVSPELSKEARVKIADEYTENMRLYIKEFTEEQITDLRQKVQTKVMAGGRYENMVKAIQRSYNVSQSKAKFLARQETSILMAKFKEARYTDLGSKEYTWRCVHNPKDKSPSQNTPGNVRYYHGLLDGTRQKWASPPIINKKGDRKNPGEDYGCRCYARPIIKF